MNLAQQMSMQVRAHGPTRAPPFLPPQGCETCLPTTRGYRNRHYKNYFYSTGKSEKMILFVARMFSTIRYHTGLH